ncbi:MAG: four helix bundle protein [Verrucomicrobiae bacterium]|nr:four helix bundle protein [Verrucomicrobiae bacterium]
MAYRSFEDLEVWKRSCRLAVEICQTVSGWREFWLRDQMQRAAVSVPSNIAEGAERDSRMDYARFLRIAKGSAAELRTQCYISARLTLLDRETSDRFVRECAEIGRMLQGLIRSLREQSPRSSLET